jgi:hypothetical protein
MAPRSSWLRTLRSVPLGRFWLGSCRSLRICSQIATNLKLRASSRLATLSRRSVAICLTSHDRPLLQTYFADSEICLQFSRGLAYTDAGSTEITVVLLGTCKSLVGSKDPVHSRHTRTMEPPPRVPGCSAVRAHPGRLPDGLLRDYGDTAVCSARLRTTATANAFRIC